MSKTARACCHAAERRPSMAAMKMLKGALLCAALPIGLAGAASGAAAEDAMRISVSDGLNEAVFELVETKAAKSLYAMLPLDRKSVV